MSGGAHARGGTKVMEQPAMEESRRIVSSHTAVFDRPPRRTPSFKTVDGPITGNGDIGLTVSGPPGNQRYWISKNDFWKSGPDFHQCGPSLIGGIDVRTSGLPGASYRVRQVLYEPAILSYPPGRSLMKRSAAPSGSQWRRLSGTAGRLNGIPFTSPCAPQPRCSGT